MTELLGDSVEELLRIRSEIQAALDQVDQVIAEAVAPLD